MRLLPLGPDNQSAPPPQPAGRFHRREPQVAHDPACAFCGVRSGPWTRRTGEGAPTCPLCLLSVCLLRPHIDRETALIWLPEMSQAALNVTIRHVHLLLQTAGEDVRHDARLRRGGLGRPALHTLRAVLHQGEAQARERLGTDRPSELGAALAELPPEAWRRHRRFGGLRLLPLGTFIQSGEDRYPAILQHWRAAAAARAAQVAPH